MARDRGQIAWRPGGLSYEDIARIETRRALLPGKRNRSGYHETIFTTTSYETPSFLSIVALNGAFWYTPHKRAEELMKHREIGGMPPDSTFRRKNAPRILEFPPKQS